MKCQSCQFENPDGMKFCGECGQEIHPSCPHCDFTNPPHFKFCGHCGCGLSVEGGAKIDIPLQPEDIPVAEDHRDEKACHGPDSERKCVTAMFSDLTGYTEMSEKLDPEEVKEITSAIFSGLTKIIEKYDGFIEKYIGDAILAVFGVKEAFEDSALRAIKAAREIHAHVESVSPKYEKLIGRPLTMHTGINTGVVVTGEINYEKGTHGLVGDTINTAARLMSVSKSGEIIIDHDSFIQTEGYFEHEPLNSVKVKGKAALIQVYRVGKPLREPMKLHRLHGLRARLIGRSVEMQILKDAAENLEKGHGSVVSVCGTAGTGKSRLVHEFKKTISLGKIQWFDAYAYPYTQNTPYYPLIDLLTKAFRIEESDNTEEVKRKVESSLKGLLGKRFELAPYIGSLFAIEYSEAIEVSPEYWRNMLFTAVSDILRALTLSGPVVICLEDMHWADPSTMQLIRKIFLNHIESLLVICLYRPDITIFTDIEIQELKIDYTELKLRELSLSESQEMVTSLLKTENIPKPLSSLIRERIEGNPFYMEELINSLVDSNALSNINGEWEITKSIDEFTISPNIQGVIAGRIDHLESNLKQILQEASVIGRTFLYEVLLRVSEVENGIEKNLSILERLDLICTKSVQPTLEFTFKHALTHEIVYRSLLKSKRKMIHEKVGKVIEGLFSDRTSEVYEALSYHYSKGVSLDKALKYNIHSGEKCLRKYAIEESNKYFSQAFNLMKKSISQPDEDYGLFIDLLLKWAKTLHLLCEYDKIIKLFKTYEENIVAFNDHEKVGKYYNWLGFALRQRHKYGESKKYLSDALLIGKKICNKSIVGYSNAFLSQIHAEFGQFDDGIIAAKKAKNIAINIQSNMLFRQSMSGLNLNYYYSGRCKHVTVIGKELVDYGKTRMDTRSIVLGYICIGMGFSLKGDDLSAIGMFRDAINKTQDPWYSIVAKFFLGLSYLNCKQIDKAEIIMNEVMQFSKSGYKLIGTNAHFMRCMVILSKGKINEGVKNAEILLSQFLIDGKKYRYAAGNYILGKTFFGIAKRLSLKETNLSRNSKKKLDTSLSIAMNRSETYLSEAIKYSKMIGADVLLAQSNLSMGILLGDKGNKKDSEQYISQSIRLFEKCEATTHLKNTIEMLRK